MYTFLGPPNGFLSNSLSIWSDFKALLLNFRLCYKFLIPFVILPEIESSRIYGAFLSIWKLNTENKVKDVKDFNK